jgi:hypothetical protein
VTTKKLLFVGECRSLTAQRKGWTWKDGRLAAKPLFEALTAMGVDPAAHQFVNLWQDGVPLEHAFIPPSRVGWLKAKQERDGYVLVALGQRVSNELVKRGVEHVTLIHPAARGKIRKRERYHAHVKEKLALVFACKYARVGFDDNASEERYEIAISSGRWRRLRAVPGNGQYAPGIDEITRWLRGLGVTHVETTGTYCDLPAKVRTLAEHERLVKKFEEDQS